MQRAVQGPRRKKCTAYSTGMQALSSDQEFSRQCLQKNAELPTTHMLFFYVLTRFRKLDVSPPCLSHACSAAEHWKNGKTCLNLLHSHSCSIP
ncbi:hypothetical protein DUNSADRAFT_11865 [Dunaliella salina]|uniref:Encoded protein n=1 Tax=Dunaliella salina TaxID=3046 RepID=A0ABQ7H471_DUNSA|nr:hypothetical protein DUNSADRAFT_11865 [Dunaliella salina]|eukprot:KAF5841658.1 hypothetical protein DUNSADRAFT_11865 [Dunaliella salina]